MGDLLLIGLAANAPGSGKTTVAAILEAQGFVRLPLAEPVKQMAATLLSGLGLSASEIQNYLYTDRLAPIPVLGVSGRHLLQTLGTEWGRQLISPTIWIDHWLRRAEIALAAGKRVVVDDVRFSCEADAIRQIGGHLWLIERPGCIYNGGHASEGGLSTYAAFSRLLLNDGTIDSLRDKVLVTPTGSVAAT